MAEKRKPRIKSAESDSAGFMASVTYERDPGSGSRDIVIVHGHRYHRARQYVVNAKGIKERKTLYGKTSADLERKVKKLLATPAKNADVAKLTVADYFQDRYLPGAEASVRPATYASYKNAFDTRIEPMLGKAKFATLAPDNVRAWIKEMSANDKGRRADQLAVQILKRAYARAHDDGFLVANPIANVRPPKAPPRERHVFTLKETIKFLRTIRKSKVDAENFPLFYCAIALGMRESELLGLTWNRVNLSENYLEVVQQLGTKNGKIAVVDYLKTKASVRTLHLDSRLVEALEMQKGKHPTLVFPGPKGGFMLKRNLGQCTLPRILAEAGLPNDGTVWFHLLRGVGASLLASKDVQTAKIDRWLGHVSTGIAAKYVRAFDSDLVAIAEVMGGILKPVWG
jgi:integrase